MTDVYISWEDTLDPQVGFEVVATTVALFHLWLTIRPKSINLPFKSSLWIVFKFLKCFVSLALLFDYKIDDKPWFDSSLLINDDFWSIYRLVVPTQMFSTKLVVIQVRVFLSLSFLSHSRMLAFISWVKMQCHFSTSNNSSSNSIPMGWYAKCWFQFWQYHLAKCGCKLYGMQCKIAEIKSA